MLVLNYSLTEDDYANYYTFVNWKSKINKSIKAVLIMRQIITSLLVLVALYYIIMSIDFFSGLGNYKYIFIIIYVAFSIFSFFRMQQRLINYAKKFARNPKNKNFFIQKEIIFSQKEVVIKDNNSTTHYNWESFIKKEEDEDYYFLFTSSVQAVIIPKRTFKNIEERKNLEKLFLQYLSFDAEIKHLLEDQD